MFPFLPSEWCLSYPLTDLQEELGNRGVRLKRSIWIHTYCSQLKKESPPPMAPRGPQKTPAGLALKDLMHPHLWKEPKDIDCSVPMGHNKEKGGKNIYKLFLHESLQRNLYCY